MESGKQRSLPGTDRRAEEAYLAETLAVIKRNVAAYEKDIARMQEEIDEMLDHYHHDDAEIYTALSNTVTMNEHMKRALARNRKAIKKPYFGRIVFWDESLQKQESLYIGRGGIARDATHQMVVDWRAPAANAYYENGLGRCGYPSPDGRKIPIDLQLKRTYEMEDGKLKDYFDTEVIANDELLTKYLARNKQAVLGEIIATIQKEQNEIIRKSPYHNMIVQGVAGSGKTTVAMHRISYILYNYEERFRPEDFYIVGSNRILLEYITGVLPDLDVYGIRQMTMEQLFVRLLYEDWDEKRYRILQQTDRAQEKDGSASGHLRGSLFWFQELEEYCRKLERKTISGDAVYLDKRQFVEGIRNGEAGVFDEREKGPARKGDIVLLLSDRAVNAYITENPHISIQNKINMLNERLIGKVKDEFLKSGLSFTEKERKAILKAYRGWYGKNTWQTSIFDLYDDFLVCQRKKGFAAMSPQQDEFDVYDLAALAYLYKRVKETEVISEAHHVVIDEAQDFGMMAYAALRFCMKDCTYTIMGDVSQNIHFGCGLNHWEELRGLLLSGDRDSFEVLKKSYRNTVEISDFAQRILEHGDFPGYCAEPIIRHGNAPSVQKLSSKEELYRETAKLCRQWQEKELSTIAVVLRTEKEAREAAAELSKWMEVAESDLTKAVFEAGVMVLPVAYTKGLEFDGVIILEPDRESYPVDDGHARLLYVAATRALHELCVLYTGDLTGLIADPVSPKKKKSTASTQKPVKAQEAPKRKTVIISKGPKEKPSAILKTPVLRQPPERVQIVRKDWKEQFWETRKEMQVVKRKEPSAQIAFGDMPPSERLRPGGHARADLSVRWLTREKDGLYVNSRCGILRLCPMKDKSVRITFAKHGTAIKASNGFEEKWSFRENSSAAELLTDTLCLRIEKRTGAILYMDKNRKLLLTEREKECRLLEAGKTWMFFDFQKQEQLSVLGAEASLTLNGSARYISAGAENKALPVIVSDKGYGIRVQAKGPVLFCSIPAYGSFWSADNEEQIDFYFSLV